MAGGGAISVQRLTPPTDNQGIRAFIDKGRVLHEETAQSALTVILKLVINSLKSAVLVAFGAVNLQLQFVPSSQNCGSFMSWLLFGHGVVNFFHLVFSTCETSHGR